MRYLTDFEKKIPRDEMIKIEVNKLQIIYLQNI